VALACREVEETRALDLDAVNGMEFFGDWMGLAVNLERRWREAAMSLFCMRREGMEVTAGELPPPDARGEANAPPPEVLGEDELKIERDFIEIYKCALSDGGRIKYAGSSRAGEFWGVALNYASNKYRRKRYKAVIG
jgi:hypothetical protein